MNNKITSTVDLRSSLNLTVIATTILPDSDGTFYMAGCHSIEEGERDCLKCSTWPTFGTPCPARARY